MTLTETAMAVQYELDQTGTRYALVRDWHDGFIYVLRDEKRDPRDEVLASGSVQACHAAAGLLLADARQ